MSEIETVAVEITKPKRGRPKKQPKPEVVPQPEVPLPEAPMEVEQEVVVEQQPPPESVEEHTSDTEVAPEPKTPRARTVTRDKSVVRTRAPRRRKIEVAMEKIQDGVKETQQYHHQVAQHLHELTKHARQLKSEKSRNLLQGHLFHISIHHAQVSHSQDEQP